MSEGTSAIIDIDDSVNQAASGQELEFQTFTFNEGSSSASSNQKGKYKPLQSPAPLGAEWETAGPSTSSTLGGADASANSSGSAAGSQHPFYRIEYYKQFFDVDSDQVLKRIIHSFMFWRKDFSQTLVPGPDLYGPFWIASTVVFVLFVTGNISGSVMASFDGKEYTPDFKMLSIAATSIYSYVFLGALALWAVCKYYQVPVSLLEVVCLYGYAMFIFIPVSVICVLPYDGLKWAFSVLAFLVSGLFIVINLWAPAASKNTGFAVAITAGILICHFGITLLFKFYFFTYSNVQIGGA